MKTTDLKKLIKEAVKEAIQEELKDILLEAVRAPKPTITENISVASPIVKPDPAVKNAFRQQMLSQLQANNGNMTLTTQENNSFRPSGNTSAEGSALGAGNVGLDQIMSLMNSK